MKFEKLIIDPILKTIKIYQEYLTQPENLPQLAKLGFIYNKLWYPGRACYGNKGYIKKGDECENNPKYKIEMCNPISEEIDDLIYDAWGMHTSFNNEPINFDEFYDVIYNKKPLTEFEKLKCKSDKTFEEWISYILHDDNPYKESSLKSAIKGLLAASSSGFYLSDKGFIYTTAAGAHQDISLYGDWRNSDFHPEIQSIVDKIISHPEVKLVLDTNYTKIKEYKAKEDEEEYKKSYWIHLSILKNYNLYDKSEGPLTMDEIRRRRDLIPNDNYFEPITEYIPYSNLCGSCIHQIYESSIVDLSYIKPCIEICEEILSHKELEIAFNVKLAKDFLTKFKI